MTITMKKKERKFFYQYTSLIYLIITHNMSSLIYDGYLDNQCKQIQFSKNKYN